MDGFHERGWMHDRAKASVATRSGTALVPSAMPVIVPCTHAPTHQGHQARQPGEERQRSQLVAADVQLDEALQTGEVRCCAEEVAAAYGNEWYQQTC